MASSPLNVNHPPPQSFRRSFTLPARSLSIREQAAVDKSDSSADILYSVPQARIFSFSPPKESIKSKTTTKIPPDTDYPVDTVETLPWRSRTETLAAAGRLMIEKVRGSTNFLKCQDIMHAVLRNSQCWCVDGESKFVLRVRAFQYYRIELPSTSEEDKTKVEELKKVLPTVLRYERTPCPFIRAFQVDLPDDAITPRRKGAWKRTDGSQPNTPETEIPSPRLSRTPRTWNTRLPPSAYPRNGPSYLEASPTQRLASSPSLLRRDPLHEDYLRSDSPISNAPSEDAPDSDRPESERNPEQESDSDEPLESPAIEDIRGRQNTTTNREARSVSVSVRVAAFETVRAASNVRPTIDRANSSARAITGSRSRIESPVPPTPSPVNPQAPSSETEEASHQQNTAALPSPPNADPLHLTNLSAYNANHLDVNDNERDGITVGLSEPDVTNQVISDSATDCSPITTIQPPETKATATPGEDVDKVPNASSEGGPHGDPDVMSNPGTLSEDYPPSELVVVQLERVDRPSIPVSLDETSLDVDQEDSIELAPDEEHARSEASNPSPTDSIPKPDEAIEPSPSSPVLEDDVVVEDDDEASNDIDDDNLSSVSSVDSFHTITSDLARSYSNHEPDLSETPRVEQQDPFSRPPFGHRRDESQMTVTASHVSDHDRYETETPLAYHINDQFEGIDSRALNRVLSNTAPTTTSTTTSVTDAGVRQRIARRRSFSPLPPASTLLLGHHQRQNSKRQITKTLLQSAIVKPIELVSFIVHILSRIASGATVNDLLSGDLFRRPEYQKPVSGFADHSNGIVKDDDAEDDYGVPIRGRRQFTNDINDAVMSPQLYGHERDNDADSLISVD